MLSFPWFISGGGFSCTSNDGWNRWNWFYGILGLDLDLCFLLAPAEVASDAETVVNEVYGIIHLIPAIGASIGESGTTVASNLLPVIPEISKLLRLQSIVALTDGISLAAIAAIDAIFGTSAAIVGFIDATAEAASAEALTAAWPS